MTGGEGFPASRLGNGVLKVEGRVQSRSGYLVGCFVGKQGGGCEERQRFVGEVQIPSVTGQRSCTAVGFQPAFHIDRERFHG